MEAKSDPQRASLVPGEQATVEWLVASPTPLPRLAYAWALCVPPSGSFAAPRCDAPVIGSGSGIGGAGHLVRMELDAPAAAAIGDAKELLLLAAFCSDGAPTLDARSFTGTCGAGTPLLASTTLHLETPNANPTIETGDVLLDGAALAPAESGPVSAPCTGSPDAPVVTGTGERTFVFRFRDEQRERSNDTSEMLLLSHVVSAGELDRQYSALDPEESAPKQVEIKWTPPAAGEVPEAGRLVEIFFVLRDGRGGVAFARHAVCARR